MINDKENIRRILKKYWGYDVFRPLQEDIILSVLSGNDTLALLPTGGGKSICFQVPALAADGLCLVISPLVALMKDQVYNLKRRGIKAAALFSGMTKHELEVSMDNVLFDKDLKFLYVSPERLKTELFKANLDRMPVSLIAVDEAHCISQWGYDFRPPYLEIAEIRPYFPKTPILALTATATTEVVTDIQEKLLFKKKNVFQKSFSRKNLTYFVVNEEDKLNRMLRIIHRYQGTGIVYVRNRKKTKQIAEFIQNQGITADYYHAGLDSKERDHKQEQWIQGQTQVIVATNAFGMGIDKPDVRFVIHLDIPDTLEAYFQEAGRGGRDEEEAVAVLLYEAADVRELEQNFQLSFPSIEQIKKIYHSVCSYYQLPVGSGVDTIHSFDLQMIAKNLGNKPLVVFNALLFLEKMGIIALSEQAKESSRLKILLDQEQFVLFYKQYPQYENFIKSILRSYGGIFHHLMPIHEAEIGRRNHVSIADVIYHLSQLKKMEVIEYVQLDGMPQLTFLENRVEDKYLYISPEVYAFRKEVAQKRLEAVKNYVLSENICRSCLLLAYFGEKKSAACGKCDVCLRKAQSKLKQTEYKIIDTEINMLWKANIRHPKEIINTLSSRFSEEKILQVLRWKIDQER